MPRISGVNIPDHKNIKTSLTYIYGIGFTLSEEILVKAKIKPDVIANKLKADELNKLKKIIESDYKIEGELRQKTRLDIKRLERINCWRGLRHKKRLPVRGQRTKSNSRTVRSNVRRAVGSGSRKAIASK